MTILGSRKTMGCFWRERRIWAALLSSLVLVVGACGARSELSMGDLPASEPPDTATPDAATPDAATPDAAICTADGEPCEASAECCVGVCIAGTCGACKAGEGPVVLASGEELTEEPEKSLGLYGFGIDETTVYWGSRAELGSIRKVDKRSGAPSTVASGVGKPFYLVVDSTDVYFTIHYEGAVKKVAKSGGEAVTLYGPTGPSGPGQLAQDEGAIYWTSYPEGVMSIAKRGGALQVVNAGPPHGGSIAVDDARIYWSGEDIYAKPKRGGDAISVANISALSIAPDEENIYFAAKGSIRRVPKAGGLFEGLSYKEVPSNIVLDEKFVYWGSDDGGPYHNGSVGAVRKIAKFADDPENASDVVDIFPDERPTLVAVDETCIYWLNLDGEVQKVHK